MKEGMGHKDTWHLGIISCGSRCLDSGVCVNRKEDEEAGRAGRDQIINSLASVILRSLDFIHNGE